MIFLVYRVSDCVNVTCTANHAPFKPKETSLDRSGQYGGGVQYQGYVGDAGEDFWDIEKNFVSINMGMLT